MTHYEAFKERIGRAALQFRQTDGKATVRIISNYDADGITACSILVKAVERENRKYSVTILQQLTEPLLEQFAQEPHTLYLFADLGTKHLENIAKRFAGKQVFILDHHELPSTVEEYPNVVLTNPHCDGIDGGKEISAAGICFFFAHALNPKNRDMAPIALVGAIGDIQEEHGFRPLNQEILDIAIKEQFIRQRRTLRCFGSSTRPVHKILEYTTNPFIPGVSGNESAAIHFLQQIGINPKNGNSWKTLGDLNEEETSRLIAGIVMKRNGEASPEDILGFTYTLLQEKENTPFRDAKEFATLLNACGRLDKASYGIGACLGDKRMQQKAMQHLQEYKKAIVRGMEWVRKQRGTPSILEEEGVVIINARESIHHAIIGTLASMMAKSGECPEGTFILGLARNSQETTKVSIRLSGKQELPLHSIIQEIVQRTGGEAGGHGNAAGALISREKEEEFVMHAKEILRMHREKLLGQEYQLGREHGSSRA
ncbi:DHH family phosphoesterase [Candidatus Woesearchaeota archaeon]|nr:DHH family phosphoesterase [Candidatus Woesearchaeota archaeon]